MGFLSELANRVYSAFTGDGDSRVLDGNTLAGLGMIQAMYGQLAVNPQTDHLYGHAGPTVFRIAEGNTGEILGHVFVDGSISDYAVHPGLSRLYATHSLTPAERASKLWVIQDAGGTPGPTPSPTHTPSCWTYLPAVLKD